MARQAWLGPAPRHALEGGVVEVGGEKRAYDLARSGMAGDGPQGSAGGVEQGMKLTKRGWNWGEESAHGLFRGSV